jgi:hypothetical protein
MPPVDSLSAAANHMRYNLLRGIVGLALLSCAPSEGHWDAHEAAAARVISVAIADDTAALGAIVNNDDAIARLLTIRRLEPDLLAAAARGLNVTHGDELTSDSAYVSFTFPYGAGKEVLDVGFVRAGDDWLVYYVGLPERM